MGNCLRRKRDSEPSQFQFTEIDQSREENPRKGERESYMRRLCCQPCIQEKVNEKALESTQKDDGKGESLVLSFQF